MGKLEIKASISYQHSKEETTGENNFKSRKKVNWGEIVALLPIVEILLRLFGIHS